MLKKGERERERERERFWICTSTEAQNQPHFSGTKVLLAPDQCGSFGLSFVWFGWKHMISMFPPWSTLAVSGRVFVCVDIQKKFTQ